MEEKKDVGNDNGDDDDDPLHTYNNKYNNNQNHNHNDDKTNNNNNNNITNSAAGDSKNTTSNTTTKTTTTTTTTTTNTPTDTTENNNNLVFVVVALILLNISTKGSIAVYETLGAETAQKDYGMTSAQGNTHHNTIDISHLSSHYTLDHSNCTNNASAHSFLHFNLSYCSNPSYQFLPLHYKIIYAFFECHLHHGTVVGIMITSCGIFGFVMLLLFKSFWTKYFTDTQVPQEIVITDCL